MAPAVDQTRFQQHDDKHTLLSAWAWGDTFFSFSVSGHEQPTSPMMPAGTPLEQPTHGKARARARNGDEGFYARG